MSGKQIIKDATGFKTILSERGRAVLQRNEVIKVIEYIVRFIMSFILARANIFGSPTAFGVGFAAAAPGGLGGISSLIGVLFGYLSSGNIIQSLKYIAAAVLVRAAVFVFGGTKISKTAWFVPASAAVMTACIGFVYAMDGGWAISAVTMYLTEIIIAGGTAFFYNMALSPWQGGGYNPAEETRHSMSMLILAATLLIALAGLEIFSIISIGRIIAVILVLLIAFKGGIGAGCAGGLALGLAMDAASNAGPMFSIAYSFSGLISGVFAKLGRLIYSLSFIFSCAIAALWLWSGSANVSILYEVFIASVIFMVLPNSFLAKTGALFPSHISGYGVLKAREYTKERVERMSVAFLNLYETIKIASGDDKNDNNIATIFDRAADTVCRKCSLTSNCWQHNYESTLNVMNDLTPKMMANGKIEAEDFPEQFASGCRHLQQLSDAINLELRSLLSRKQYKSRLQEKQGIAYNQYADTASVLQGLASELGGDIGFDPFLERKLQKFLRGMDVDVSVAVFRDRGGRLHAELTGSSLYLLKREKDYLDKLSAVLEMRLCASDDESNPAKLVLLEAEPFAVSVGIATMKKQNQDVSGDRGTYFKTDDGIFYVLLSDGMGTGCDAAKCSGGAVKILERFLRAGVSADIALRILNGLMLLKNENDSTCATIDLMSIDLFSGETRIYKYGAAPSYIKKGKTLRRVKCKSLAAGLSGSAHDNPDIVKMKLEPGSFAVIASDGLTGFGSDDWLRSAISEYDGENSKELARMLMKTASEKPECDDDMTVLAIRLEERA